MSFWIAAAQLSLRLRFAGSLKDRRHVVRSLTDGVRGRFAISASDLGPDGCYNDAELEASRRRVLPPRSLMKNG